MVSLDPAIAKQIIEQELFYREVQKLLINTKKKGSKNFTLGYLNDRLASLSSLRDRLLHTHANILMRVKVDQRGTIDYFINDVWASIEFSLDEADDYITEKLNEIHSIREAQVSSPAGHSTLGSNVSTNSHAPLNITKLPKIELPKFAGDYSQWSNFHDLFVSLIHENQSLAAVQKLHYLKCCLTGEAASIVSALAVNNANYETAWKAVNQRYENKRILISSLLNRLFTLPDVNQDQLSKLKLLRDTVNTVLESLNNVGCSTDQWDPLLIHLVIQRFNNPLRREWESKLGDSTEYPSLKTLENFIDQRIRILEVFSLNEKQTRKEQNQVEKGKFKSFNASFTAINSSKCSLCSQQHLLFSCPQFKALSISDRNKCRQVKNLCNNCLSPQHPTKDCKSSKRCFKCGKSHHTLLHYENRSEVTPSTSENPQNSESQSQTLSSHLNVATPQEVLLSTAIVQVRSAKGLCFTARALVDPGSETSFISETLAQALNLPRRKVSLSIAGLGGCALNTVKYSATFSIAPNFKSNKAIRINAYVLQTITSYSPKLFNPSQHIELKNLQLADPQPAKGLRIELLLGADIYGQLIEGKVKRLRKSAVIAQKSKLGWLLSGPIKSQVESTRIVTVQHAAVSPLDSLTKFWEIENVPHANILSPDDKRCEEHFLRTVSRDDKGRYTVQLPFKSYVTAESLGNSKAIAISSWQRVEKRISKNQKLANNYNDFLSEYEQMGHMTRVSNESLVARVFLPHHAVLREQSATSKVRVVFNASAKTSNGVSLNDLLHTGPKLQNDITNILNNWRTYKFVLVADVEKMFRQINVAKPDRKYQCIIWKKPNSNLIDAYELNTVTYGIKSAPYLANRVMQHLVDTSSTNFPLAKLPLKQQIYVDDVLFRADEQALAIQTRDEIEALLATAGFPLRKWSSNCKALLPVPKNAEELVYLEPEDNSEKKVLGIVWSSVEDSFKIQIGELSLNKITKRTILSCISRLFDPLGWLSPFIVRAKMLLQAIWIQKLDWDDDLTPDLQKQWAVFYSEFSRLKEIKIPRWIGLTKSNKIKLIGLSDASTLAYSAAVYAYIYNDDETVNSHLLMAKTRVAPIKTITIPKLELCGAVLLAKLIVHIRDNWIGPIVSTLCYTDSNVVLDWLAKHPSIWETFVANRVSTIQTLLPEAKWCYTPTKFNPADLNSRGCKTQELISSKLWWHGPQNLTQKTISRNPNTTVNGNLSATITNLYSTAISEKPIYLSSSWSKSVRVIAYLYKAFAKRRPHSQVLSKAPLEISFILKAENYLLRQSQTSSFTLELKALKSNNPIRRDFTKGGTPSYPLPKWCEKLVNEKTDCSQTSALTFAPPVQAATELPISEIGFAKPPPIHSDYEIFKVEGYYIKVPRTAISCHRRFRKLVPKGHVVLRWNKAGNLTTAKLTPFENNISLKRRYSEA